MKDRWVTGAMAATAKAGLDAHCQAGCVGAAGVGCHRPSGSLRASPSLPPLGGANGSAVLDARRQVGSWR